MSQTIASDPVLISGISTLGGIAIAYITNVLAKRQQSRKAAKDPKDRVEQLFDGYERALRQKDEDIEELRKTLREVQTQLRDADKKLNHSYYENSRLKGDLEKMRSQYHSQKTDSSDADAVQ